MVVLVTGMFMSVLDVSIVNVAIPTMQRDFGSTTEEIQWVATAYSLAVGVIVPLPRRSRARRSGITCSRCSCSRP